MVSVTFVVTNMELVIVHDCRFLKHPLKETAAGEGLTLFSWVATPNLAVFQNIVLDKLIVSNFICNWSAKQSNSLGVHYRIFSLRKDTSGIANVKRI